MPNKNINEPAKSLNAKFKEALSRLGDLPKTFRLVWFAAKGWTIAWFILLIVQGLLPGATVYLTKLVVDGLKLAIEVARQTRDFGASFQVLSAPAIWMALVLIVTELLQGLVNWVRTVQSELLQDYISGLIQQKSVAADIAFYESPEYYDKLERARSDASSRSLSLLENSGSLLQNSITLLTMAAVLIPYGWWLPIALIVSMFPALIVVMRANQEYYQWWQKTTTDRRKSQYYELLLTLGSFAPEVRLFSLGSYYQSAYQALRQRLRDERLRLMVNQSMARLLAGTCGLVIAGGAMVWMVWRALLGLVTLGDLALFYQAFNRGQGLTRTLLGNVGQVYTNSLFIGNLFEFLLLEPKITDPPQPVSVPSTIKSGISFKNVSFHYPGTERSVLQNFNFTIPAGKIVAIVGDNGAGKSTLIKLLCRFYDPDSGSIELDGIDFRDFSQQELRRLITVLFQDPAPYQDKAFQNIALGDLSMSADRADIETAARAAGAHEVINRLPQKYDQVLGKWFADGTDLSGGEWQRVALARAFFRRAQIIILDEPTSAMDSWAEADWLERFRTLANGRTALVITHRFTLAMRADIIHVMRNGQIVESGTHKELLEQGGFYAQSWETQINTDFINQ
ncbi:ABC transporter ATP-binding protein [Merismopedia glauca]|uniref:Multidrug ABC transporter ATP-binding protein n=1 Tax=Merismopedia glauca CCAP 1448/3 TaxID=1296344 RepID=A0A2T1C1Y3_9CYAN|nr:ABC transporter ATP-binding protein [Merismopedia glauca]PSB02279.1 multidrug ABC transporter ATP-binding protein [Merismopedia glauca CCAP 1448/3]